MDTTGRIHIRSALDRFRRFLKSIEGEQIEGELVACAINVRPCSDDIADEIENLADDLEEARTLFNEHLKARALAGLKRIEKDCL